MHKDDGLFIKHVGKMHMTHAQSMIYTNSPEALNILCGMMARFITRSSVGKSSTIKKDRQYFLLNYYSIPPLIAVLLIIYRILIRSGNRYNTGGRGHSLCAAHSLPYRQPGNTPNKKASGCWPFAF
ncbi:hypothetical protein FCH31_04115 [Lelliottia amnigena]|uniref:hypothetical protein n=1 Tax=Lelliottia amnigena TaxID=61646 RepID=UPI001576F4AF|nr:hypothetical protein [Lelliottia amnigena]NTX68636.1 hypothetical protein [Lelliottia amnigena]